MDKEELNKEQIEEDLIAMAKNLKEAVEKIKEVYTKLIEIYESTKCEN